MIAPDDIKTLKVAKYKCQTDFLFFTRYFFKSQYNRKLVIGDHHKIICSALERVIKGECKRLIINIAPRYGKTEIAVKSFIAHGLALNPSSKYIHLSYSDSLALDNSEAIKDLVSSLEYQTLFPEVQIKKDSKAKEKWYTSQGGGVLARAAGGSVTGFGAGKVDEEDKELQDTITLLDHKQQFGGAIIIDDPIKPEDADSDVQRGRVNSRFDSTIRNRVNSRNTPIIIIMQRLHPQDLCGYLTDVDPDEWEVISLPCINPENQYGLPVGEALWPFRHTLDELNKMKHDNDIVFERQYMQNPKPKEGLLFPLEDLQFYNPKEVNLSDPDFVFIAVDPAGGGSDDLSAPCAILKDGKIFIDEVIFTKLNTDFTEPAVIQMFKDKKANAGQIEGNFNWSIFANRVRMMVSEQLEDCEIRVHKATTNKHVRILAQSAFIKNKMYFRADYNKIPQYNRFMQNLTSYLRIHEGVLASKHDDAPDSLAMVAKYFQLNFSHIWD